MGRMNVKNKIIQGIFFCASLLLLNDTAYGFTQTISTSSEKPSQNFNSNKGKVFSGSNPSLASLINIGPTETGIIIQVKNGLLIDVFQQIAKHTNIQFRIVDQLSSQRINVNIQAQSWDSGIESLLEDFSKVIVWDKYSRMENILILGTNKWESPAGPVNNVHDNRAPEYRDAKKKKPGFGLSISNLKKLVQVQLGHSFPPSLFADQEIRRYLKLRGIHSINDWKQTKKIRVVSHLAKRELVRLLYEQKI
jgi:hypothetical protein